MYDENFEGGSPFLEDDDVVDNNVNWGTVVKLTVAGIIGTLPGVALWLILGKIGYIATLTSVLLVWCMIGVMSFSVGKSKVNGATVTVSAIIGCVIFILAIWFSIRMAFVMRLTDSMKDAVHELKTQYSYGLSSQEIDDVISDVWGIEEVSFKEINGNFDSLIRRYGFKSDYTRDLVQGYAFSIGGIIMFLGRSMSNKKRK